MSIKNNIVNALENYLDLLQAGADGVSGFNVDAEIKQAQVALGLAREAHQRESIEAILGALYRLGYEPDHTLYRITIEDFAARLAKRLAEDHRTLSDLSPGDLETLVVTAADYLNGEGMPWADVIDIALDEEWPFLDEDDNPEGPEA
jgi:hypothetical protein